MQVSVETIKELREMTSCGVIECRNALKKSDGDINKAKEILQQRGLEIAAKKGNRQAKDGRVEAYIHLGAKIGVLVEVNCETDFVAKNEDFCEFSKNLAMHIAASSPKYVKKEDIPPEVLESNENQEIFIKENCLLNQPYVRDPGMTVNDYLTSVIAKIGENIIISRFVRYKVGDGD